MSLLTVPFSNFVPISTIVAAQANANNAAIIAWSTSIDTSNIGAAGINISKLVGAAVTSGTGNDSITLPGGIIIKWGSGGPVPADGSAEQQVTFTTAFPTAVLFAGVFVHNAFQSNPWGIVAPQTNTELPAGFKFNLAGAPPGSTVNVFWLAIGN